MHVVSVASARPNFVKLAAVHHAFRQAGIRHDIVHTGQHYDPLFSDVFFEQLSIPAPTVNLGVRGATRKEVIAATDSACREPFTHLRPDWVLVYGDVNGAAGAAQAAHALRLPLAHVEAGLRSFDASMPEELNRLLIDRLADLLFCSEVSGMENIAEERLTGKAYLVGNTMIDTLIRMLPSIASLPLPTLATRGAYVVATLHRPSNVDDAGALTQLLEFLGTVARTHAVILPAHHRLQAAIRAAALVVPTDVHIIEPLAYLQFLRLVQGAQCVLTDSGGIQEECVLLQKRCFTLRRNTERPSTIASGSNQLIDPSISLDRQAVLHWLQTGPALDVRVPEYWDGRAGEKILDVLRATV